jgi:hypothetical protein
MKAAADHPRLPEAIAYLELYMNKTETSDLASEFRQMVSIKDVLKRNP